MPSRGDFIKSLMAGIAAAPLAAKSAAHEHVQEPGKWREKHWSSGGLKFSEYTLPVTMSPTFEEDREDRPEHRIIWIPLFDRKVENSSLRDVVAATIEATTRRSDAVKRHGMPIVDEDGNELDYGTPKDLPYVTILKIDGHPDLCGVTTTEYKLRPIRDFYRDVASRNNRIKRGMGQMEADYSKPVELTEKEKGARNQENEGGWRRHRSYLRTL
jgi:hypothetical protein